MILDVRGILFPKTEEGFLDDVARPLRIAEDSRRVAQQPVLVAGERLADENRG